MPADRALCEGSETPGTAGRAADEHDTCIRGGGFYRVKDDETLIKHRPTPGSRTLATG